MKIVYPHDTSASVVLNSITAVVNSYPTSKQPPFKRIDTYECRLPFQGSHSTETENTDMHGRRRVVQITRHIQHTANMTSNPGGLVESAIAQVIKARRLDHVCTKLVNIFLYVFGVYFADSQRSQRCSAVVRWLEPASCWR